MTTPVQLCFGCMEARAGNGFCPRCGYQYDTVPTSPIYLKPGTVLQDQYVVGRVLGHGGFGVTYLGFDNVLQRKIAIKEYLPSSLASRQTASAHLSVHYEQLRTDYDFGLQRFLDEARTLARFHAFPNIIWVMNFFAANGTAYMVMEYLDGQTFESYLGRHGGRISFSAARAILTPVMDALREVHRQNMLHRDVSPDNIFLVNAGPVKLLDFGAARYAMSMRSRNLSVIVKEGYAPEEQYSSKSDQGAWTDVYALAGTMYRALTGQVPVSSLERRRGEELVTPSQLGSDLPSECEPVLLRALAVNASERYRSVEEFQAALDSAAKAGVKPPLSETRPLNSSVLPAPAPTPSVPPVTPPPKSERVYLKPSQPWKWLWLALAAVLLIGLGFAAYRNITKPAPPAGPPQLQVNLFSADNANVSAGKSTRLAWQVSHASRIFIVPEPGEVAASGSVSVTPSQTTTYRLTAIGLDGKSTQRVVQVVVTPVSVPAPAPPPPSPIKIPPHRDVAPPAPALPLRLAFVARPGAVRTGQAATLQWSLENAVAAEIEPAVGALTKTNGEVLVQPQATTTYRLTARAANGATASSMATVTVLPAQNQPPPPVPGPIQGGGNGYGKPALNQNQFLVAHMHGRIGGILNNNSQAGFCMGVLSIQNGRVTFRTTYSTDQRRDDFDEPLSAVTEARKNRFDLQGRQAFHIRFQNGENYNFEPRSGSVSQILEALSQKSAQ